MSLDEQVNDMVGDERLSVAEHFYSLQGEGPTVGYPSVFIRLRGCNLLCGNPDMKKVKDRTDQKEIEEAQGEDAKWICDTIATWLHGSAKPVSEWYDTFEEEGYIDNIKDGAHLILTGGEPTLQQNGLIDLVDYIEEKAGVRPYVEIETNGTRKPTEELDEIVGHYNCSAKLSNSGMPKSKRYDEESLEWFSNSDKTYFKFVTLDDEDTQEIMEDFIEKFDIPNDRVYLMPGAHSRELLTQNSKKVAELCKDKGFRYSSRLQLEIWDESTGV